MFRSGNAPENVVSYLIVGGGGWTIGGGGGGAEIR